MLKVKLTAAVGPVPAGLGINCALFGPGGGTTEWVKIGCFQRNPPDTGQALLSFLKR
jgi:hypothetical protein